MKLSDISKAALRSTGALIRRWGPPALRKTWTWARGHKMAVLVGILLLYIFFRPTRLVVLSTPPAESPSSSTVPAIASGLSAYDPSAEGADPKWGLPAKLNTAENQSVATKVAKLKADAVKYFGRNQHLQKEYQEIASDKVRQLLFDRVHGNGFKDQEVPLLWHQVETGIESGASAGDS